MDYRQHQQIKEQFLSLFDNIFGGIKLVLTKKNITSRTTNKLAVSIHFITESSKFNVGFTFCRKFRRRSQTYLTIQCQHEPLNRILFEIGGQMQLKKVRHAKNILFLYLSMRYQRGKTRTKNKLGLLCITQLC